MLTNGKILATSLLLLSTITIGWFSSGPAISQEKIDAAETRIELVVTEIETNVTAQKTEEESANETGELLAFADKQGEEPEEKPDGKIVRVDSVTRRVWINFGSEDMLRPQVTFSVYAKGQVDIGKNKNDIKAKIVVIKITNEHLAECRIFQEDFDRPIQVGDLIVSPLFNSGQIEVLSFIGTLDLDGDGRSDRKLLRDIIKNAGAKIELEIDDQGNRIPEKAKMTDKTKVLVVGDIPDPRPFAKTPKREAEIDKIIDEFQTLQIEALRKGIKVVALKDFLNYIGYQNKERLFIKETGKSYNLKSGSRSRQKSE